jgi:hypothetical protein
MDYTFASKTNYKIQTTSPRMVRVARGGHLDTNDVTAVTPYIIQIEVSSNEFKLLLLKDYDIILGCDWIKQHSPIGLDFRDTSRNLTIQKDGQTKVTFSDFTTTPDNSTIIVFHREKLCRTEIIGCHPSEQHPANGNHTRTYYHPSKHSSSSTRI